MENVSPVTYKGLIFKIQIDELERIKGPAAIKELKKSYGPLTFLGFKNYPAAEEIRLQEEIAQILYGKIDDDSWFKLGEVVFNGFANSQIGKTLFPLFGTDIKVAARYIPNFLSTVSTGVETDVTCDKNEIRILMFHEPHNPHHYAGVWKAAARKFGIESTIQIIPHSDHIEYFGHW